MYMKYHYENAIIQIFIFDPIWYRWGHEIGKPNQLEPIYKLGSPKPGEKVVCQINNNLFDWGLGKNGYGAIGTNGKEVQGDSYNFPTFSLVDNELKIGSFENFEMKSGYLAVIVQDRKVKIESVVDIPNEDIKDARSFSGQLKNGNCFVGVVEGNDQDNQGLTVKELAEFLISIGARIAFIGDGGGSVGMYVNGNKIYYQGRHTASAFVIYKKPLKQVLIDLVKNKVGCGYWWGTQGETATEELLAELINIHGLQRYYFNGYNARKWLGKQVFDCSGLFVWALTKMGLFSGDVGTYGLWDMCIPVSAPEKGDFCFSSDLGHVGIYIGNDKYLHARGTYYGVVITGQVNFTRFGKLKILEDDNMYSTEFVKAFQKAFGLKVDGIPGPKTEAKFEEVKQKYYSSNNNENQELQEIKNSLETIGKYMGVR